MKETKKVSGMVELISERSGGIKVNGVWYNSTPITRNYVARMKKGEEVSMDVDEKFNIHFIKKDPNVIVVDESKAIEMEIGKSKIMEQVEKSMVDIRKEPNINDRIFKAQCLNIAGNFLSQKLANDDSISADNFIEMLYKLAKQICDKGKLEGF